VARSNPRLTAASRRRPCADFAAGGGAEAEPRGGGGERNSEEQGEARKRFFAMRGVVVVRPRYFTGAAQVEAHAEHQYH
jgi:hypothetical protein